MTVETLRFQEAIHAAPLRAARMAIRAYRQSRLANGILGKLDKIVKPSVLTDEQCDLLFQRGILAGHCQFPDDGWHDGPLLGGDKFKLLQIGVPGWHDVLPRTKPGAIAKVLSGTDTYKEAWLSTAQYLGAMLYDAESMRSRSVYVMMTQWSEPYALMGKPVAPNMHDVIPPRVDLDRHRIPMNPTVPCEVADLSVDAQWLLTAALRQATSAVIGQREIGQIGLDFLRSS